jgi:2-oxoisovalerate dehydrogenase E1 component
MLANRMDAKVRRMDPRQQLALYRSMATARQLESVEQDLAARGEAFFFVSSGGHEANAALAMHLLPADWLHCHYRDKALLIARGLSPKAFLDTLLCKQDGPSSGRQMSPFLQDASLNILPMTTPVANQCLQACGVAAAVKDQPEHPLVVCALGDGSTQQGEFLEAVAEAVRSNLPVLFLVENNRWAISTCTTGKTFFSLPTGAASELFGLPIQRMDGRDALASFDAFEQIVANIRASRGPALVVMDVERMQSHTNADDQRLYRSTTEISAAQSGDPVARLRAALIAQGVPSAALDDLDGQIRDELAQLATASLQGPEPQATTTAKKTLLVEMTHPARECRGTDGGTRLTMREALRDVLHQQLLTDERVTLLGEDIEDPKGDVFGVTRGLSSEFPDRVKNAPLTEATILGTAVGRALAGQRPVTFIQFADFLPPALNQLMCELGTMQWRTDGEYHAPVIVMIACGGYRPGLGPFHAQTNEAILAHTPGVDVFMPSTAADAAGMLNAAFASGRPTLFLYPKSLLNDSQQTTSANVDEQFVPIGVSRKVRAGRDITLVGWGNTVKLCEQTAAALESAGVEAEVLDLRSLSPWDERSVLASAEKTARLVVVHEDNVSCGVGAEVLATVVEKSRVPVAMRRVARPDTYVPCNFANQLEVLPSFKRVLTVAAELLNMDLSWLAPPQEEVGFATVEALGSGPADETVVVSELRVAPGDYVAAGQTVALLEATKSVFELSAPTSGMVEAMFAAEGDTVPVGSPLLRLRTSAAEQRKKPVTSDNPGTPILARRASNVTIHLPRRESGRRMFDVGISNVATVSGSRMVTNEELLRFNVGRTNEDILRRTGIERRNWATGDENAVSMAVRSCWQLLEQEKLLIDDLDLVICSTTSPTSVTPSMACQVLAGLARGKTGAMLQAYDINAACSGYLYALQSGYDYLQSMPQGRVLVVTAEVLSPLVDRSDFDTAILFGDATSATILYGEGHYEQAKARLYRPDLSAKGEDGTTLSVPLLHSGFIQMKGQRVFAEAVRSMIASLNRVCDQQQLAVNDLNLVVPHQANQRILDAIQHRIRPRVYSNIREHGNTSSSSIPLCLAEVIPHLTAGERVGLCAFGGGFTFGAGILEAA